MDIEKFVNSKIYSFFDWLWRILVLNVVTMITSIGIVTFIPSIIACFQTIKDFDEKYHTNIFKSYFKNFKLHFKRAFLTGLLIILITALLIFSAVYYFDIFINGNEYADTIAFVYFIGFYIILFCMLVLFLVVSQVPMIFTYFYFRIFDNFRIAFFMAFKYFVKNLAIAGSWGLSFLLLRHMPQIWFFIGLSLPLFIVYRASRPIYMYLTDNTNEEVRDLFKEDNLLKGEEENDETRY